MTVNMVRWPITDSRFIPGAGGGMYAMLVIPMTEENEPDSSTGGCVVCTHTYITRPDACVNVGEADVLWGELPDIDSGSSLMKAEEVLEAAGHKELADVVQDAIGRDMLTENVHVSVFLGATNTVFCDRETYEVYQVTPSDLDEKGTAVYAALKAAYQVEPLLLTFLDT